MAAWNETVRAPRRSTGSSDGFLFSVPWRWYQSRFGVGNGRSRKIGIVALARKLLIALWKYLEQGEVPAGARLSNWQKKVKGCPKTAAA